MREKARCPGQIYPARQLLKKIAADRGGEKDRGLLAARRSVPGVFERFPNTFEKNSLLRIGDRRFTIGISKEFCVEEVNSFERRTERHIVMVVDCRLSDA